MDEVLIINDLHLGVRRSAGTTPKSSQALSEWLHDSFCSLIADWNAGPLIINGDLFDDFLVPATDTWKTYRALSNWCIRTKQPLILSAGNHDVSKDTTRLSTFELVGQILKAQYGDQVAVVLQPGEYLPGIWVIPHTPSQTTFDDWVRNVPRHCQLTLVHANWNSPFSPRYDHSLSLSAEQASNMPGIVIFGHEHQYAEHLNGKVILVGNPFPTSVSDCINCSRKIALKVRNDLSVEAISTWIADNSYIEVNWRSLRSMRHDIEPKFVRVIGQATEQEAVEAITSIAGFRSKCQAFVVANAVRIEGAADFETTVYDALTKVKQFDVLSTLLALLSPREAEVITRLLDNANNNQA